MPRCPSLMAAAQMWRSSASNAKCCLRRPCRGRRPRGRDAKLVGEADSAAFLDEVEEDADSLLGHPPDGRGSGAAVAPERAQEVAGAASEWRPHKGVSIASNSHITIASCSGPPLRGKECHYAGVLDAVQRQAYFADRPHARASSRRSLPRQRGGRSRLSVSKKSWPGLAYGRWPGAFKSVAGDLRQVSAFLPARSLLIGSPFSSAR
jgi:hypothetical protein